jgi:hypothetical protein
MIGDTAYYVAMGKHPAIYAAAPGADPIATGLFPADPKLQTRPDFTTPITGPASAVKIFKELEGFTVASGLYSLDGQLYLLTRQPESGQTAWFFYKIDPASEKVIGALRLPTSAPHLTVVPSKDSWILIERGTVEGLQRQTIDKIIVIPASLVSSLTPLPKSCPVKP